MFVCSVSSLTMAAAWIRIDESMTSCPICMSDFDGPRSLPCLHTFCLKCLENHWETSQASSYENIICPMCRAESQIPVGGLTKLPLSFVHQQLIETKNAAIKVSNDRPCEFCAEEYGDSGNAVAATVCCIDCQQYMCDACSRPHKRIRGRPHQLVKIEEDSNIPALLQARRANYCQKHEYMTFDLFCFDCSANVCPKCYYDYHLSHRCDKIENAVVACRQSMESDVKRVTERVAEIERHRLTIEKSEQLLTDRVQILEMLIRSKGDEVKKKAVELVDSHVNRLICRLQLISKDAAVTVDRGREECDVALTALDNFKEDVRERSLGGHPHEVTGAVGEVRAMVDELMRQYAQMEVVVTPGIEYVSPPASVVDSLAKLFNENNVVGDLVVSTHERESSYTCLGCRCCPIGGSSSTNAFHFVQPYNKFVERNSCIVQHCACHMTILKEIS